jgi:hypothetical protein
MQLIQKAPIGTIFVELDSQECQMLRLLMCPDRQIKDIWIKLWASVSDYEELHFFCKDFMPTVVARLNRLGLLDELIPLVRGNRHFMRGLPKFMWSKNQLIIREARQVAILFGSAGLDFSFVKGVGRMLEIGDSALYRISRDIDVLVPWDQFNRSIELLLKNSWVVKDQSEWAISSGWINAITLHHPIHRLEIDLHRSLFHDGGNDHLPIMNQIWSRAKISEADKHLYILSRRDQLVIAINNTFNLFNWETSQFCKYICDLAQILEEMNDEELSELPQDLEIVKQTSQFFQITGILEALGVKLPRQSLSQYQEIANLENNLVNYQLTHKNKIAIQGVLVITIIGWHGTIKMFWSTMKKNPFRILTYFYLLNRLGIVLSRLFKNIHRSVFSIEQKSNTSLFKNRLKWYLFG